VRVTTSALCIAGAIAVAVSLATTRACLAPSDVVAAEAPASEFSAPRALAALRAAFGDPAQPHPVGTPAHDAIPYRFVAALSALGLQPHRDSYVSCAPTETCARVTDVIAEIPGRDDAAPIVATAHYDSVPISPGVSDDGAGCAALLEIAAALRAAPPLHRRVVLVFADGEEIGLLGARAFAAHDPIARRAYTVVNLEARGTTGPSLMFQTSHDNGRLVRALVTAPHPVASSVFPTFYEQLPNDTDLSVYLRAGAAGINFAFIGDVTFYHSARDDLAELDPRTLQHQGESALATIRALADDADEEPGATLVYFDVGGAVIARWPVAATDAAAIVLLALVALAIRAVPRPRASAGWWRAGAHAAATIVAPLVIGLAIAVAAHLVDSWPWVAHPIPYLAAVMLATLAVVAVSAAPVDPARWLCLLCAWVVFADALAVTLPGMSYPAMLCAAVGCVATIVDARRRAPGAASLAVARLVTSIVAAIVWFPLGWLLFDALGLIGLPVIALCATPPLACWIGALFDRRIARRIALAAAALAVIAVGIGVALPPHSAAVPQRLGAQRIHDVTTARASWALWFVGSTPAFVPPSIRDGTHRLPLPWQVGEPLQGEPLVADAPVVPVVAPELADLATSPIGNGRRVTARLVSHRGARRVMLAFPPDASVADVRLAGQPITPVVRNGWRLVAFDGAPADGVAVELTVRNAAPVTARIVDIAAAPLFVDGTLGTPPDDVVPTMSDDIIASAQTL
jgi:hypothetical protein